MGGKRLCGEIAVAGSKNASLPIMATALLADGQSVLRGVPDLADIRTLGRLLEHMGCVVDARESVVSIDAGGVSSFEAPYDLVRTMRASFWVLGPLLARFGTARVSLPGGCAIGARPVDQHLKGLERLGVRLKVEHGYVVGETDGLHGAEVVFDVVTVGGTEHLMMAASLARGTTILRNSRSSRFARYSVLVDSRSICDGPWRWSRKWLEWVTRPSRG